MNRAAAIESKVCDFMAKTEGKYPAGIPEFFARNALGLALASFQSGNYGIGAQLVRVANGAIEVYDGRNWMVTGTDWRRVFGHAESSALMNWANGQKPDRVIPRDLNEHTRSLSEGLHCYGTLEPCPMCAAALTNAGAKMSVSTVLDGQLSLKDGYLISDGAAVAIGEKGKTQPAIWQIIQAMRGLKFTQLHTDDKELVELSREIFEGTREEIDHHLGVRE